MASSFSPPSPPSSNEQEDAAAVCCMCGDRGLPRELLRCKSCRVRLQHSYCSDLYPRAAAYTRCNWCLREPAQGGGAAAEAGHVVAADTKRRKVVATTPSGVEEERLQHRHEGFTSSRRAPAEPGAYPVKKQKQRKAEDGGDDEERVPAADAGVKVGCTSNATGVSKTEELVRAGKVPRPRARVKVRRYRLLAEVISC